MSDQMTSTATSATTSQESKAGKYLTFVLAGEEYGLEILKVREINGIMDITAVPHMPSYIKGVINLRGKVIPVIDLRLKFGIEEASYTAETCIIVVDVLGTLMGIVVDQVSEVLDVAGEDIEDPPSFGTSVNTDFILGMGKAKGSVKILLAIDKVLGDEELTEVSAVA
ncbi:chemotaxis protein CheW [bacterium]|nr:chemotaxis protein CheW [bacterium]MBU1937217.1 chemotaxis protein CheW [bacterium]